MLPTRDFFEIGLNFTQRVKTDGWKKTYQDLIEKLPGYARDARLTLCGLSTPMCDCMKPSRC
jgi:hypothetical protein